MKAHLLFADRGPDLGADLPPTHDDVVRDLELQTLLSAMAGGDRFLLEVSRRVLLDSVDDPDVITFRQRVLADCLGHPDVVRRLYDLAAGALGDRRGIWSHYGGQHQSPGSNLSGAVGNLEAYVARLQQLRNLADEHASIFSSPGIRTLLSTVRRELDDDYFDEVRDHLKRLHFGDGVLISAALDRDNSPVDLVLRTPAHHRPTVKEWLRIGPRSSLSFTVPPRDEAGGRILGDLASRGINLVANAAAQSADHLDSFFTLLRWELGFYVACCNLHDRLAERGAPVSFPDPAPVGSGAFSCTDLRDACLLLVSESPVVGNDVEGDDRPLVIVTGANSGGKSTFLRSVGVAQLMMQCGLFVTAASHRAAVVRQLFTHFVRPEDATMASGRLDEELARMSVIADHLRPHCLVLFNESFAGTNEREGSEIARQIVRALLQARVGVVFVTHRFDFAERFSEDRAAPALSLRAERRPDGQRDYRLVVARPLPTSFGEDLYRRVGGWLGEDRPSGAG